MAINYPTSLDTFTNPSASDSMLTVSHSSQHTDINDAVEALEAKVGITSSTATDNTVLRGTGAGTSAWGQIDTGDIASGSLSGSDTTLVTGTAGGTDTLSVWNADGDIIAATVSADTPISISSGAISIDGDQIDIDFTPTNYTPDAAPAEASDVDDLTAHLKGIDTQFASASITEDQLQVAQISLSAANIIAMYTTPVQLIAAPGAGKVVIVDQVAYSFNYGTTQFTGGGDIRIQYDGTTDNILSAAFDANKTKAASDSVEVAPMKSSGGTTALENTIVEITNATASFATGDGTAEVFVRYRVLTL